MPSTVRRPPDDQPVVEPGAERRKAPPDDRRKKSRRKRRRKPPSNDKSATVGSSCQQQEAAFKEPDIAAADILGLYAPSFADEYEVIEASVDSGAGVSVMPEEMCADAPTTEPNGRTYKAAGDQRIADQGQRTTRAITDCWDKSVIHARVCKVRRMLLAVSEMVDKGNKVVLDHEERGGSYVEHRATGKRIPLFRKNGIFLLRLWVKRSRETRPRAAEDEVRNETPDMMNALDQMAKGAVKELSFQRQAQP